MKVVVDVAAEGDAERVGAARVSAGVFELLGSNPLLGRTLSSEEDRPGHDSAVVISHRLWQRRFGGARTAVGAPLVINGKGYTVVGVMPAEFIFPPESGTPGFGEAARARGELWMPLAFTARDMMAEDWNYGVVGRLRPGISIERARTAMSATAASLRQEMPKRYKDWDVVVRRLHDDAVEGLRPAVLILSGATVLILLITCANVSNLLLARAVGRQKEIAIRAALGASRPRLAIQILTECLLLAGIGVCAGVILAVWVLRAIVDLTPSTPRLEQATIDVGVLVFALGLTVLTGLLVGLAPALKCGRASPNQVLNNTSGSRGGGSRRDMRLLRALVASQIALSVILTAGALLLIRSFAVVMAIKTGFNAENVLTLHLKVPYYHYRKPEQWKAYFRQVEARAASLPGVQSAGLIDELPLAVEYMNYSSTTIEGQPPPKMNTADSKAEYRDVSKDYFRTLGIPVLRGRAFQDSDTADRPPVAVVSATAARVFWPGTDPIGKRLKRGEYESRTEWAMVVGVVGDVRQSLESEPRPLVYRPAEQSPFLSAMLAVRGIQDAASMLPGVTRRYATLIRGCRPRIFRPLPSGSEPPVGSANSTPCCLHPLPHWLSGCLPLVSSV